MNTGRWKCTAWITFVLMVTLSVFGGKTAIYAATAVTPGMTYSQAAAVALNAEYSVDSDKIIHFYKFDMPNDGVAYMDFKLDAAATASKVGSIAESNTSIPHGYYTFFNISPMELSSVGGAAGVVETLNSAVGDGGYITTAITDAGLHTTKKIGLGKGTYYFAVVNMGCNKVPYTFSVRTSAETDAWETEFNGKTAVADPMVLGQNYYGSNTTVTDEDIYQFVLTSNAFVTIQLNHEYQPETDRLYTVTLSDSANTTIMTYTIKGSEMSAKRSIGLTGVAPGTVYYVRVRGGFADNGYYSLNVSADPNIICESENNGNFDSADVISVGTKVIGTNTSALDISSLTENALTDTDYYVFSTPQKGVVSFTLTHDVVGGTYSKLDSHLYTVNMYNKDREAIYSFTSGYQDTSTKSAQIGLPAGTYYVSVTGRLADEGIYGLKVNFTKKDTWECEDNDIASLANTIQIGKTYGGSLHTNSDVDFYKIKVTKDGRITLKFMQDIVKGYTSSTCYKVKIYDSKDLSNELYTLKVKGEDTSISTPSIGVKKGTYYIKVSSVVYTNHNYRIKVSATASSYCEKEPNDSVSQATAIKSGKQYTGSIRSTDDVDYYKINMKKTGYMTISLKHSDTSESSIYKLYLYNKNRDEMFSTVIKGNQNNFQTSKIGLPKGNYYVMIKAYSKAVYTGDYKLTVTTKASGNWESEPNNTMESADKIAVGTVVNGTSMKKSSGLYEHYDYFRFTVKETTKIQVSLAHDKYSGSESMWDIYVLDKDGNRVTHQTDYAISKQGDKRVSTGVMTLKKGTYYVEIYAHSCAAGKEYKLAVNKK